MDGARWGWRWRVMSSSKHVCNCGRLAAKSRLARAAVVGLCASGAMQFFLARRAVAAQVTSTWNAAASNVWSTSSNWANVPLSGAFPNNGNAGVATYDALIAGGTDPRHRHRYREVQPHRRDAPRG